MLEHQTAWALARETIGPTAAPQAALFALALSLVACGVYAWLAGVRISPRARDLFDTAASVVGTVAVASGTIGTLLPLTEILPLFEQLAAGEQEALGAITAGLKNTYMSTVSGLIIMAIAEVTHVIWAALGVQEGHDGQ